jgi:multidrug efflux pump subunit AcrA (membrane-fusion protein)
MMPKDDAPQECRIILAKWTDVKEQIDRLEGEKEDRTNDVKAAEAEVARRQAELDSFVSSPSGVPSRVSPPKRGKIPRNAVDLFVGVGEAVIDALGDARRRGELRSNLQRAEADLRTAQLQLENVTGKLRDERLNDQRQGDRFYSNGCGHFMSQP